MATRIQESSDGSAEGQLGDGTSVWHLAQVREGAVLGENCIIGRGAHVGPGVRTGDNCKLQNYALVYEPAVQGSGVFIGPAVVFTNDHYPRQGCAGLRAGRWGPGPSDKVGRPCRRAS